MTKREVPQAVVVIVALGASNTAGYGVAPERAYPAQLELRLRARGVPARVLNAGMSGQTTGEMLARLDDAVPAGTRLVILQPGGNDERRGIPDAVRQENIDEMTWRLSARGIPVLRVFDVFEQVRGLGLLQSDQVHFTAAGYARIADLLVDRVVAALPPR